MLNEITFYTGDMIMTGIDKLLFHIMENNIIGECAG